MNCENGPCAVVLLILVTLLWGGLFYGTAGAEEALESSSRVLAATGTVRVEWRSMGEFHPRDGIGFFVHPDGFIVTSLDLVADPAKAQGRKRSSSRMILLTFTSWGENQGALPAKLLAQDRRRNLALLKVDFEAVTYLEVSKSTELALGDPVWVVEDGSIFEGDIGEIERGSRGRAVGFATSLGLATSSMGGPLIDREGEVVGIRAKNTDGQRASRSVPTRWLRDFLTRHAVDVTLDPAVISDLAQPMVVRLDPVMVNGKIGGGQIEVQLEGQKSSALFLRKGGGWEAEITLPALDGGAPEEATELRVVISLDDGEGQILWKRRITVDVLSLTTGNYGGEDDASSALRGRAKPEVIFARTLTTEDSSVHQPGDASNG